MEIKLNSTITLPEYSECVTKTKELIDSFLLENLLKGQSFFDKTNRDITPIIHCIIW
jgi:hypothetical protein